MRRITMLAATCSSGAMDALASSPWYAQPEQRVHLVRRIFDQRYIFTMQAPPFQSREYCWPKTAKHLP